MNAIYKYLLNNYIIFRMCLLVDLAAVEKLCTIIFIDVDTQATIMWLTRVITHRTF